MAGSAPGERTEEHSEQQATYVPAAVIATKTTGAAGGQRRLDRIRGALGIGFGPRVIVAAFSQVITGIPGLEGGAGRF